MKTKERFLEMLTQADGFLSGTEAAKTLGVSRNAVWKYVKLLREEGFLIEAVTNRGYRLLQEADILTEDGVQALLNAPCNVVVLDETASTNNQARELAAQGAGEITVVAARRQHAGRGRMGRSFFSPDGGLYFSLLLRPSCPAAEATCLTAAAAVSVAQAMEENGSDAVGIKWVNDMILHGKKVCGILTEASINVETGLLDFAIVGIGMNVYDPNGGFPEPIADIAGSLFGTETARGRKNALLASVLTHFQEAYQHLGDKTYLDEYRRRSTVVGKDINVLRNGSVTPAHAVAIDEDFRLIAEFEDGKLEALSSGEISVRIR